MKKNFFILIISILFVLLLFPTSVNVNAKSDYEITKEVVQKKYKKPIKLLKKYNAKIVCDRKNKKYVVVEKVVSISNGKGGGFDKDGYYIAYNKKVKKGKKVVSYLVYNPKTNYEDDVVFVIDNNKIR